MLRKAKNQRSVVGDHTRLDTGKLKTGLAIVTKRVDTGSVWVLCNNPRLHAIDDPGVMERLHGLAAEAASMQVRAEDFARFVPQPAPVA